MWFSKVQDLGRLCFMLVAAAALTVPQTSAADEVSSSTSATSEAEAAQRLRELLLAEPSYSFDTAPVYFYINHTLFTVPRNLIVQMPEHVVEDPGRAPPPSTSAISDRVILHVVLPDMAGLTEGNAECQVRGPDCEQLVRVNISTDHMGSALVTRQREAEFYPHWGGIPTQIADDLVAFPLPKGRGRRSYLGRLTPEIAIWFECNVPEYFAPLCTISTGLDPGRGRVTIFFNKSRVQDWRLVYEGVQRLIATFKVEY